MTNSIDECNARQFVLDHYSHFARDTQGRLIDDMMTALVAARSSQSRSASMNSFSTVSKR